jgi:hypothetical protein
VRPQRFRVVGLPWREPVARQCAVQFEAETGQRFVSFVDGLIPELGVTLEVETFYWIANDDLSFDTIFNANREEQQKLEPLGDWDYMAYGPVVEIEDDELIVDCGGVLLPLPNVTRDRRVLGAWVGFKVERLEAEIAGLHKHLRVVPSAERD